MTPIFMRIWLMKITMVFDREIEAVSLRSAWLIRRACRPGCTSPISPSISARGVSAATESMTSTSTAPGAHQRVGDLQRLLASVGLRDQQVFEIDAELAGIDRVERVFRVDEGADAAALLRLGDDVQGEGRLARRFRAVDLDHAAARQAADAERDVETERARRDGLDLDGLLVLAEPHDRALAEGPLDLRQRRLQRLGLVHGGSFHKAEIGLGHRRSTFLAWAAWGRNAINVPVLFSSASGLNQAEVKSATKKMRLTAEPFSHSRAFQSPTEETAMSKMTWYAAGALVAWVLVGAAAMT